MHSRSPAVKLFSWSPSPAPKNTSERTQTEISGLCKVRRCSRLRDKKPADENKGVVNSRMPKANSESAGEAGNLGDRNSLSVICGEKVI